MTEKNNKLVLFFLSLCLFPALVSAQILEVENEKLKEKAYRIPHVGLTLSGTSGLITIPTADFQEDRTAILSYKYGLTKQEAMFNNTKYDIEKNEHFGAVAINIERNLEFSVNYLKYKRSSEPALAGLNYWEDATAFGLKYSTHNGPQDFCFGVNYAPMTAEEMNKADLWQLEHLRSVYMTVTEDVNDSIRGYIHLKTTSTDDQKLDLGNGQQIKIDRKDFLTSGLGLEYTTSPNFALILEGQFFNYRDIFKDDSTRFSLNGGMRFGSQNLSIEVAGLSLNKDPRGTVGAAIGF